MQPKEICLFKPLLQNADSIIANAGADVAISVQRPEEARAALGSKVKR